MDMSLSKLQEIVKDRKAWCPWGHKESDMTEKQQQHPRFPANQSGRKWHSNPKSCILWRPYFVLKSLYLSEFFSLCRIKNKTKPKKKKPVTTYKLRVTLYLVGILRTSSLRGSISSNPKRTVPRRWIGEESGHIEVCNKEQVIWTSKDFFFF